MVNLAEPARSCRARQNVQTALYVAHFVHNLYISTISHCGSLSVSKCLVIKGGAAGAVAPVIYLISWDRCTGFAAGWCGAFLGMIGGIITWMVSGSKRPTFCAEQAAVVCMTSLRAPCNRTRKQQHDMEHDHSCHDIDSVHTMVAARLHVAVCRAADR